MIPDSIPMPLLPTITLLSLAHFAGAILWSVLILLSVAGYGSLLLRLAGVRRAPLTTAASAGFAVTLLLGGLLNLRGLIAVPVLYGFLALGLLAGALGWYQRGTATEPATPRITTASSEWLANALLLGFVCMFALRLGASVHTPYYQISDDYNFYLASPVKMLQTHHFAADPFSERRIMSSLGGNNFLEVLVLAALPVEDVQMADRAVGLLLLGLLAFRLSRQFSLTRVQTAAMAVLFVIMPQLQFNLTFVILPAALFLGMVSIAADTGELQTRPWLQALLLGMVAGSIGTIKSTYIVHGVIFFLVFALLEGGRRGVLAGAQVVLVAGAGCLLVMAPWMIANHQASATWFYPSLGQGYHYSRYRLYPPPGNYDLRIVMRKVLPFNAPMVVIAAAIWVWGRRDAGSRSAMTLAIAAAVASILVGVATGGDSVRRYNYPCLLPAILLTYAVFASRANASPGERRWRLAEYASAAFIVLVALSVGFNTFTYEYGWYLRSFRASLTDFRITSPEVRTEYAALQAAIPQNSVVLETVAYPFLLDYRQHRIYMADVPGGASLPPGWPARQPGEALADYLKRCGIRYVAYSYHDGVELTDEAAAYTMHDPRATQWIHSENALQLDAHHQYEELAQTRKHVFDDGRLFVLDLKQLVTH